MPFCVLVPAPLLAAGAQNQPHGATLDIQVACRSSRSIGIVAGRMPAGADLRADQWANCAPDCGGPACQRRSPAAAAPTLRTRRYLHRPFGRSYPSTNRSHGHGSICSAPLVTIRRGTPGAQPGAPRAPHGLHRPAPAAMPPRLEGSATVSRTCKFQDTSMIVFRRRGASRSQDWQRLEPAWGRIRAACFSQLRIDRSLWQRLKALSQSMRPRAARFPRYWQRSGRCGSRACC